MRKMQNQQNYNIYNTIQKEKSSLTKKMAQKVRTSDQEHIKTFFIKYTL